MWQILRCDWLLRFCIFGTGVGLCPVLAIGRLMFIVRGLIGAFIALGLAVCMSGSLSTAGFSFRSNARVSALYENWIV